MYPIPSKDVCSLTCSQKLVMAGIIVDLQNVRVLLNSQSERRCYSGIRTDTCMQLIHAETSEGTRYNTMLNVDKIRLYECKNDDHANGDHIKSVQ